MRNYNQRLYNGVERPKYNLISSFGFAIQGIWFSLKKERNLKIELGCALLIILIGFLLKFNLLEWLIILLLIAMVLSAEIFNSSIEMICNLLREKLKLEYHETAKQRNISSGAVLLIAFVAALVGLILVLQKIIIFSK